MLESGALDVQRQINVLLRPFDERKDFRYEQLQSITCPRQHSFRETGPHLTSQLVRVITKLDSADTTLGGSNCHPAQIALCQTVLDGESCGPFLE